MIQAQWTLTFMGWIPIRTGMIQLCFREAKERGIHRKNKTKWKARLAKYKGHQT